MAILLCLVLNTLVGIWLCLAMGAMLFPTSKHQQAKQTGKAPGKAARKTRPEAQWRLPARRLHRKRGIG